MNRLPEWFIELEKHDHNYLSSPREYTFGHADEGIEFRILFGGREGEFWTKDWSRDEYTFSMPRNIIVHKDYLIYLVELQKLPILDGYGETVGYVTATISDELRETLRVEREHAIQRM